MEKPRDASGQSEIRAQIPFCLQMLTDYTGDYIHCNKCSLFKNILCSYGLYYLRKLDYLRIYIIVLDLQLFHDSCIFMKHFWKSRARKVNRVTLCVINCLPYCLNAIHSYTERVIIANT